MHKQGVHFKWKLNLCSNCWRIPRRIWRKKLSVGKCLSGACEQLKDNIKEKDVVTQSIKQKSKTFGIFLGHGMFGF